jgi:hypothetical protein
MDATKLILGISFKERAIFAQGYQSVLGLRRFVVFCCIYWEGVLRCDLGLLHFAFQLGNSRELVLLV